MIGEIYKDKEEDDMEEEGTGATYGSKISEPTNKQSSNYFYRNDYQR